MDPNSMRQSARQHDPEMQTFYQRIGQKHGSSKAIVAVTRKMLSIMHVMLTRNEPHQGENRQLTEQKDKRLERIALERDAEEPSQRTLG